MMRLGVLFFIFLLFVGCHASARLQIGRILNVKGAGLMINEKNVTTDEALFWGDKLATGKETILNLIIYPSFSITVKPSSEIKLIGGIVEQNGQNILSSSAVRVLKGKIQANVKSSENVINTIKVFGQRSISAIRGTTFEINTEAANNEVYVEEGLIDVEPLVGTQTIQVRSGKTANLEKSTTVELLRNQLETPNIESAKKSWEKEAGTILTTHRLVAKKYKKALDSEIASLRKSLLRDIVSMRKTTKGIYDQFKNK